MPDLDLTGDIALAIDGAAERGSTLVLGYVAEDGTAALSFRGSTQVHAPDQLAIWSRRQDEGLARAAAATEGGAPVSLIYYSPDTPGAAYLSIKGRARLAPEINDTVYAQMIEGERGQDPDRGGVALIVDVDSVQGAGADGYFVQERAAG